MSIDLDAVKRRYTETVTVTDAFGRAIKVGRLKPSQRAKASEMAGNDSVASLITAICHVRAVDDKELGFPESRAVVNSRMDMLENEGQDAIVEGMKQLYGVVGDEDDKKGAASVGEAGKSS